MLLKRNCGAPLLGLAKYKCNETLRLNRYEKVLSPLCFSAAHLENFVINQEQNLFSTNHITLFSPCHKSIGSCF